MFIYLGMRWKNPELLSYRSERNSGSPGCDDGTLASYQNLNPPRSSPEINLSLCCSPASYTNTVQLHYSRVHKITLRAHRQKSVMRWKNTLVLFSDERLCGQVRAAPETSARLVFPQGRPEPTVKTNKQRYGNWAALYKEFWEEEAIVLTSLADHCFSLYLSKASRKCSLSLGVSGKRKKADVIHFQMAA